MRLICPNCSAQYEIDLTLIPDEGRDVQCSNCGHTWFELPPPAADFAEAPIPTEDAPEPEAEAEAEAEAEEDTPSPAVQAMAAATEDAATDSYEDDLADEEDDATLRRPADAADVDLLREEAERELSQRRAPPTTRIETQTEMGIEEIRDRRTTTRALRARMAHLGESEEEFEEATAAEAAVEDVEDEAIPESPDRPASQADVVSDADYQAPRRDLLPDIDEINSTLKPTRRNERTGPEAIVEHRSGFRAGFLLMTVLAVALILLYAQAPAIARAVPGSETALLNYVDGANSVRDWIDGLIGGS